MMKPITMTNEACFDSKLSFFLQYTMGEIVMGDR